MRGIVNNLGLKALSLDVHSHTLRHSFAIHILNSTNNPAKLKQLPGHSIIKSTEHYLKYTIYDIYEELRETLRW
jgi:site-specific recombinase XerC